MKKLLLATTGLAFAGSALAADMPARMPVKALMKAPAIFSWTGCYIGAHAGYGWGRKDFTDPLGFSFQPVGATVENNTRGFLGGGQLGCNYQFAQNWVAGVEGDVSWADIKADTTIIDPFFAFKNFTETFDIKTNWLATGTGRLGYAWDHWLLYAKGGVAWAHDKYDLKFPPFVPGSPATDFAATETRFGWTIGGGLEWAFQDNWSAKVEFDYFDFGTRTVNLIDPTPAGGTIPADIKQRIEVVKFGINYRFAPGAAVTARY
jgi:outer membrane immunogenic protein